MFDISKLNADNLYYTIGNKKYVFNIEKLKEICILSTGDAGNEKEITEMYGINEVTHEMELNSKVDREVRSSATSQKDVMMYDMIKSFVDRILDADEEVEELSIALSLSINTLIAFGLLVEVK